MNSRFVRTIILALIIVGGIWILANRDRIQEPADVVSLIKQKFSAVQSSYSVTRPDRSGQPQPQAINRPRSAQLAHNVIRIASFRLNPRITGPESDAAIGLLADICRRYDAIAFQEIDGRNNTWLTRLTDQMNSIGALGSVGQAGKRQAVSNYFFVTDRSHNLGSPTQSAIVFNRGTLELDQSQWYTVNDPDNLLTREPMVAWFRARGPAPDQAFTFSLVNLQLDTTHSEQELAYLGELFRAIRDDGRGEDDVVMVGDFNAGDQQLEAVRQRAGLTWVVSNRPTTTRNQAQFDNLVFNEIATVEFTGRGGIFDFMRHYNLRLDDAVAVSDHMPVWAEFSVFEGIARRTSVIPFRYSPPPAEGLQQVPLPRGQAQTEPGRVATSATNGENDR